MACGSPLYPFPDLMGSRDLLVLTYISVGIRNKNSSVFLFDLPPCYSPLRSILLVLLFKVYAQFLVKVLAAKPLGFGCVLGSPDSSAQPHGGATRTGLVYLLPTHDRSLFCVNSPL